MLRTSFGQVDLDVEFRVCRIDAAGTGRQRFDPALGLERTVQTADTLVADQITQVFRWFFAIQGIQSRQRKLEREEKERIETAKKEARLQAEELRQKTFDDRKFAHEQVERLKKEVAAVQAEVAKFEEEKRNRTTELVALKELVQKAEGNQKYYYDLLDKIAAADKAKAEAEALAAAAAKKNS